MEQTAEDNVNDAIDADAADGNDINDADANDINDDDVAMMLML